MITEFGEEEEVVETGEQEIMWGERIWECGGRSVEVKRQRAKRAPPESGPLTKAKASVSFHLFFLFFAKLVSQLFFFPE